MNYYSVFFNGNLVSGENVGFLFDRFTVESVAESLRAIDKKASITVLRAVDTSNNQVAFCGPKELGEPDFELIYPVE